MRGVQPGPGHLCNALVGDVEAIAINFLNGRGPRSSCRTRHPQAPNERDLRWDD
jgi:hypothetical protein